MTGILRRAPQYHDLLQTKEAEVRKLHFKNGVWNDIGFGYLRPPIAMAVDGGTAILIFNEAYYIEKSVTLFEFLIHLFCQVVEKKGGLNQNSANPSKSVQSLADTLFP